VVSVNKNKDVIDANGKNKEWNDFNDDKSRGNTKVTEETNARCHGCQDNQDSTQTKYQLHINLQHQPIKHLNRSHNSEICNIFSAQKASVFLDNCSNNKMHACNYFIYLFLKASDFNFTELCDHPTKIRTATTVNHVMQHTLLTTSQWYQKIEGFLDSHAIGCYYLISA